MGQKKISVIDLSAEEQSTKVSQKSVKKSPKKAMTFGKDADSPHPQNPNLIDLSSPEPSFDEVEPTEAPEDKKKEKAPPKETKPRERGRRYKYARSMVDRTQAYPLDRAVELVKRTTISRFGGTLTAHLNLKEAGISKEVAFPFSTGKTYRVAIADEALLTKIEAKQIDFDILIAPPDLMPKLAKLAKILGPLGLMPNPKNGTISEAPEKRKQELEGGKTQVKSEAKAPLMHVTFGKVSQPDTELIANIKALTVAVGPANITKLVLASTMSPGVKVGLTTLESIQVSPA